MKSFYRTILPFLVIDEAYTAQCSLVKITSFLNRMDQSTTYIAGVQELVEGVEEPCRETCNPSNSIGKCGDDEKSKTDFMSDAIAIEVNISESLYGENVTVDIEVCECCTQTFYLPNFKQTG